MDNYMEIINIVLKVRARRFKEEIKNWIGKLKKYEPENDFTDVDHSYYLNEVELLGIDAAVLENGVLQLSMDNIVHNVFCNGGSWTDFDGGGSLKIAGDKVLCSSMLKKAGLPIPEYTVLKSGDYRNALAFKKHINGPIVIKPARDTGDGCGVFIRPESLFSIWYAANKAGIYGKEIIVEQFFEGTNYRLLFCNNRFLAASSRNPAYVVGDGRCTIMELIETVNAGRFDNGRYLKYSQSSRPILYKIQATELLVKWIKKQGYDLNSVLRAGEIIRLQEICHWLRGGHYTDVTDVISPQLIDVCKKAVGALGIKLAGVDMIAQDIINPRRGTYVINEVNTTPDLLVHYEVQNQEKMRPVAKDILKMMFGI